MRLELLYSHLLTSGNDSYLVLLQRQQSDFYLCFKTMNVLVKASVWIGQIKKY